MTTKSSLVVQAALALERMAFVIAEPTDADPLHAIDDAPWRAAVTIDGEDQGFVSIAATDGFVREVAAGMLGIEPDEVDLAQHGEATIMELANVLGGHAIHEGGGDESPLRLGLPLQPTAQEVHALVERAMAHGFAGVVATDSGRLVIGGVLPAA